MGWKERLGIIYGAIRNTTIDLIASALNAAGTIACAVGGGGFAASQAVNKSLETSYFSRADVAGDVMLAARFKSIDVGFNISIPVATSGIKEGEDRSSLPAYLSPETVQIASTVIIFSGVILRSLGANLNKVQQHREDRRYYQSVYNVKLPTMPYKELLFVNAEAVCASLSIAFFSSLLVGSIVYYLNTQIDELGLTYPSEGDSNTNSTYYHGPVESETVPIILDLGTSNIIVTVPYLGEITIELDAVLDAVANVTGGVGARLPSNGPATISPAAALPIATAAGLTAYVAKNFFTNQIKHRRDARLIEAQSYESYRSINSGG